MTHPSERFLMTGIPTAEDLRYIETLERRRKYLLEELRGPDYSGSSYDRAEVGALSWALALVAEYRKDDSGEGTASGGVMR